MKEWIGWGGSGRLTRKSEALGGQRYDKVALRHKLGNPQEVTEKLGWVKKEHGLRYNHKWNYYYRRNRDSQGLTKRTLYFIDDEFQGSVIIDEEGRARREKIGFF